MTPDENSAAAEFSPPDQSPPLISTPYSSEGTPLAKRAKQNTEELYTKHPIHWAPDGDVFVHVLDVKFRLHSSRLLKHSGWFRELPGQEGGEVEEIRVVCLDETGVTVTDPEILLNALEVPLETLTPLPPS